MASERDTEVLDPIQEDVAYRGDSVAVLPLRVGNLPKIARLAKPILGDLEKLVPGMFEGGGGKPDAEIDLDIDDVLDLIAEHGDAVFDVAALAVERESDWLRGGDIAEFVGLAKAILVVNRDFFTKMLRPLLGAQAARVAAQAGSSAGDGQTPSSSSLSAATG